MTEFRPLRRATLAIAVATTTLLGACAYEQPAYQPVYAQPAPPPAPYGRGRVVPPVAYNTGYVQSIEVLRAQGPNQASPVGAIAGAVIGGLLGNQIGAGGGRAAATAAGVIGGGLAGNEIGRRAEAGSAPDIYRIEIRFDGGGSQFVDVGNPGDLRIGDRVRIDPNGQISRY